MTQSSTDPPAPRPLSDDELVNLLSKPSEDTSKITSIDEELDHWIDSRSQCSEDEETRDSEKSVTLQNDIFMYNFFQRRRSQHRAAGYLNKIESVKGEKIRERISKIRKLSKDYISLPVERIAPEDAKVRENLRKRAIEASMADEMHGLKIMRSILPQCKPHH